MEQRQRIAIIGGGIAGLSAAYVLRNAHDVTLYEKDARLGGHARTLTVNHSGKEIAVDTGFIVFNDRNYPHLNDLFSTLNVPFHKSNMSFAARISGRKGKDFEYSSKSIRGIFPTLGALMQTSRWQMLRDYFRFSKAAKQFLQAPDARPLSQLVADARVGDAFTRYFIMPMGAAIWSCPVSQMMEYPAATFVRFFHNHGLLDYNGQPQWYTVTGGSRSYVTKIADALGDSVRTSSAAKRVMRCGEYVEVTDASGNSERFDQAIFACHADEALAIHQDATPKEREILSSFRFNENTAYLHSDTSLMPHDRQCWASWVYLSQAHADDAPKLAISYWMNLLQGIDASYPLFVTLNPPTPPSSALTFNTHIFTHPIFDQAAIDAQLRIPEINGKDRIWWCGAWQRYGFHEDGIESAMQVVKALGIPIPWQN